MLQGQKLTLHMPLCAFQPCIHRQTRLHTKCSQQDQHDLQPASRRKLLAITSTLALGFAASQAKADESLAVGDPAIVGDAAPVAPPAQSPNCLLEQSAAKCNSFKVLRDPTLAYAFVYPTTTQSGRQLPILVTRQPERYSSAAPLTADARQRIVCQLADLKDFITISVSVGPPSGILADRTQEQWKPKEVADAVLIDRSTARVTTGQRVSLASVERVETKQKDGQMYYVYEHVSQGSPRIGDTSLETFRHAYAVTTIRPGLDGTPYLYTLNCSCPEELWADLEQYFWQAVTSFTLENPSKDYVAPDKDPWRFF